jgi:hypothetical protein
MRFSYTLRLCAALLLGAAFLTPRAHAQLGDDLSIYGFFQTQAQYNSTDVGGVTSENASFSVQQTNLFLANQFSPAFSAFVNAEIRNTLSTADGFGELRLEEAWLRYNHSSVFNVKVGRLIPTFNNLNEIKNRTPLIPYIFRPHVYESSYERSLAISQFVPDQAFLQVNGTIPTGELRFDYAAYIGNGDKTNLASAEDPQMIAGSDTTLSKLVGGRVGLRWHGFKAGVSSTFDKPQHGSFSIFGAPMPGPGLGEMDRVRMGADLSFTVGRLFAEAEYIGVHYALDSAQEEILAAAVAESGGFLPSDLDGEFYYGLLGVNITEKWFAYGRYDLYDEASFGEPVKAYNLGAGFRPIFPVVIKAQYHRVEADDFFTANYLFGAVSVSF